MKLNENQKQTIIHIDTDVYVKARTIAQESQRSFDQLVELCLRRMINQCKYDEKRELPKHK